MGGFPVGGVSQQLVHGAPILHQDGGSAKPHFSIMARGSTGLCVRIIGRIQQQRAGLLGKLAELKAAAGSI
jgi:hypothetical protein